MRKDRVHRYNKDWMAVSSDIRLRRANNHCEQCSKEHGKLVWFLDKIHWRYASETELALLEGLKQERQLSHWQRLKMLKLKQVALTVAHIDRNEQNDNPKNLICLCQWCHLAYDRADNVIRRHFGYTSNHSMPSAPADPPHDDRRSVGLP